MLRGLILIQMGINRHHKIPDRAHKCFEKLFDNIHNENYQSINPNIRAGIYLIVVTTRNEETFEQLKWVINRYNKPQFKYFLF
jgi:hypothetical protein